MIDTGFKSADTIRKYYFPKIILEENIPPGSKVLEIGCGPGYFLKECDEYGLETYGIDKDCEVLKKLRGLQKRDSIVTMSMKGLICSKMVSSI